MNDIEILENMVQQYKSANFPKAQLLKKIEERIYKHEIIAIENLIQRNKDLKQIEKEHKEENGRLREENEVLRYGLRENKILRHGLEENTEEIDKLYKIINLMAEELADWYMDNRIDNRKIDKQYVINKFTNKVEESDK